ncbi:MAG: Flagellar protein FliT [Symbiobacteriaceae bacterium]|nr:Flagellar protein FliT [Symbiobacteriaceae bacterium]
MTGAEVYLAHLQDLTRISEEAEAAASQQDWEALNACLSRRQAVIDQVDALPPESVHLSAREQLLARQLLTRAAVLDAKISAVLDTALASTRSVLQEGSQTKAGISAYRRSAGGAPHMTEARFVDKNR